MPKTDTADPKIPIDPNMSAINAICLWDGRSKELVICYQHDQEGYRYLPCSDMCCSHHFHADFATERAMHVNKLAFRLVHHYGFDPEVVHREFLKVKEYRMGLHYDELDVYVCCGDN